MYDNYTHLYREKLAVQIHYFKSQLLNTEMFLKVDVSF